MNKIIITGNDLTIEDVINVARRKFKVELSTGAINNIQKSREVVDKLVSNDDVVYGITTGFGSLSNVKISKKKTEELQKNLIISHAAGVGSPFNEEIVRAVMLLRVNTFAKGYSGIRLETVQVLIDFLNKNIYPYVPSKGSVGSSGDLSPLSHIVLTMLGLGEVILNGERTPSIEALNKSNIKPITLTSKEGLALNNGTPVMTAIATLLVYDSENLLKQSIMGASLTFEALQARSSFLDEKVHLARPHAGQILVAKNLRKLIEGSSLINSNINKVQDAYSIRATPVVIGATLDAIRYVREKTLIEINSATDNPLIINDEAYSAANFHGQPMALALDFLKIALSEIANISDRRIFRLLDPNLNEGLPAFLINNSGVNSGFMIPQYTTAALVSENKVLAHPASVDSIPTCANQEDHVSMGTVAARNALEIFDNTRKVIAIELLVAAQGVELRDKNPSPINKQIIGTIREKISRMDIDRIIYTDLELIEQIVVEETLIKKIKIDLGV